MSVVLAFPRRATVPPARGCGALSPAENLEGLVFVLAMAVDIYAGETRALYARETGDFRAAPDDVHAWLFGTALGRPDLIPQLAALGHAQAGLPASYCDELVAEAAYWQSVLATSGSAA